jgi:hypothetical protein
MCKFCSKFINSASNGMSSDIDVDSSSFVISGVERKDACESFLSRMLRSEKSSSRPTYEVEFRCDDDDLKESQVVEEDSKSGFVAPSKPMFSMKRKKKSKRLERLDQIERLEETCTKVIQSMFVDTEDLYVRCIEIKCGLPGCPPLETVMFVLGMEWSPSRMYIRKSLMDTDSEDISTVTRELWSKWRQWELRKALKS